MSTYLSADSVAIGSPLFDFDDSLQITTTDGAGHFVIPGVAQAGVIAAQLADRRSKPATIADHVRLVLTPTRSVSGGVDLGNMPHTRLAVSCMAVDDPTGRYKVRNVGDINWSLMSSRQEALAKPIGDKNALKPALEKIEAGDLMAHFEHVIPGELTVCAIPFNGDLFDQQVWQRMRDHVSELAFNCEPIGSNTAVVVLPVPTQRRFE